MADGGHTDAAFDEGAGENACLKRWPISTNGVSVLLCADSSQREADDETEDGSSAGSSFETIMEAETEAERHPVNFTVGEEDDVSQSASPDAAQSRLGSKLWRLFQAEGNEEHTEAGDTFPSSSSFASNSGMSSNRNSINNMADLLIERRRRLR